MTRFICLTCYKTKDGRPKWWNDRQCCIRCYDKYERLSKPVRFVDKIDEQIASTRPDLNEQDYGGDPPNI